jgi:hypothetical protein
VAIESKDTQKSTLKNGSAYEFSKMNVSCWIYQHALPEKGAPAKT